jgi:DNA-binding transcriptional ArsR family regulator
MVKYENETLDAVFSALSDPTRRAMLERLSRGACSVTELARPFEISLPAVSKHLAVLESAGLVLRERDGRVHTMHLQSKPMKDAAAWLDRYHKFWTERFDALEKFLTQTKK